MEFTFDDLEIARECLFQYRVPEQPSFRYLAHQQVDNDRQLVHSLEEAWCSFRGWSTAYRLLQISVGGRVIQLDCLDAAKVVMIA